MLLPSLWVFIPKTPGMALAQPKDLKEVTDLFRYGSSLVYNNGLCLWDKGPVEGGVCNLGS